MTQTQQVLLIDPSPAALLLVDRLRELGVACAVAHGLHDAMVQAILRNPKVIVADLSRAGDTGEECRRRLTEIPHFETTAFVNVGKQGEAPVAAEVEIALHRVAATLNLPVGDTDQEVPDTPTEATLETALPANDPSLREASPLPEPPAPASPSQDAPTATNRKLTDSLRQLAADSASVTLMVRTAGTAFGEVMVRNGQPLHAVTWDGLTGPAAFREILSWEADRIDTGPEPRIETPDTLSGAPSGAAPADREIPEPDADYAGEAPRVPPPHPEPADAAAQPPAAAPPAPASGTPAAEDGFNVLLEQLEAVGVVRKVTP
ncbi:MAG: hypothetical protein ACE5FN_05620 [Leptospirillia bacterium]